ncbi:MAG: SRPBCC family protein [Kofleriaceae bacterium]|nr:SRPBCC family protein [Kofleriaceae bacterium]
MRNETRVERKSDREVIITRTFNASARIVFEAWTKAEHMRRWWVPKSSGLTLLSCEMDVRTGGSYRFVFEHPAAPDGMAFFGRYLEVSPYSRLVWTNDESGDAGQLSTLTLEDHGDTTRIVLHEVYPSAEALEAAKGAYDGMPESFDQLDALLAE